jgi:hypothetical protein
MLGGDSLLAVEIVSRTGAMFGVELPRGTMFRNATVAAFAAEVRKLARPERIAAIAQTMERVAAMSDAEVKGSLSGN